MRKETIDPEVYDLYDEYCHSLMNRRNFITVASALDVVMGADLNSGAPFYGTAQAIEDVPKIVASLMIHYAENDLRINARREALKKALNTQG